MYIFSYCTIILQRSCLISAQKYVSNGNFVEYASIYFVHKRNKNKKFIKSTPVIKQNFKT